MAVQIPTYVETISSLIPTINVRCSGNPYVYEDLIWESGDPLPTKEALDIIVLEKIKLRQWKAIQEIRDTLKSGGVKVGTDWFHSDDTSRIQQLGLVMFGANMPSNIMWKTMSGSFVLMTPTLALQIFQAVAVSDMTIFTIAEQKRAAMMAMPNPADYDQTTGWPETFTG